MKNKKVQDYLTKNGKRYGVSIYQDDNGFYACTHRARSKSYSDKKDIPISVLKFIESTG